MSGPPPTPLGPWSSSSKTVWGNAPANSGQPFTAVTFPTTGAIVQSLSFWVNISDNGFEEISGITMSLTDGTTQTVGYTSADQPYISQTPKFILARGETISDFTILIGESGHASYFRSLRGLSISTNKGRSFTAGNQAPLQSDKQDEVHFIRGSVDVGSGYLAGFYGAFWSVGGIGDEAISALGVLMVAALKNIDVGVTKYNPDPTKTTAGINLVALSSVNYSDPGPWTFHGSIVRTATSSYSSEVTENFGGSASITVGGSFFGIETSATGTLEWTSSTSSGTDVTTSQEVALEWGTSGDLATNTQVTCTAVVSQGILNVTYDSTVIFNFVDPTIKSVQIAESGAYNNVAFSIVDVHKTESPKGTPN